MLNGPTPITQPSRDWIYVHGHTRPMLINLDRLDLTWPPPEALAFTDDGGLVEYDPTIHGPELLMVRSHMSPETDEQMRLLPPNFQRLAVYRYDINAPDRPLEELHELRAEEDGDKRRRT